MLDTTKLTTQENISLAKEIALVAPIDTPFATLMLGSGRTKTSTAKVHTWREKSLSLTDDISVAEGSEATNFAEGVRAELNNVMEIFMKSAKVSGTAQATGAVRRPGRGLFLSVRSSRFPPTASQAVPGQASGPSPRREAARAGEPFEKLDLRCGCPGSRSVHSSLFQARF